jgi:hypothetical protein
MNRSACADPGESLRRCRGAGKEKPATTKERYMATRLMSTLLTVVLATAVAQPVWAQTSEVSDPVGDAYFRNAPAFQDVVFGRMTKTADGDFELLMELASPIPDSPPMPAQQRTELWWGWNFDLDTTAFPNGYPWGITRNSEFLFLVRWDGAQFTGTAIDRRPLLTGGEAVSTPVAFDIDGTTIQAVLPFALIGEVPESFEWAPFTIGWAGPVGSEGVNVIDVALTVFNAPEPESPEAGAVVLLDPPAAPSNLTTRPKRYRDRRMPADNYTYTAVSWRDNSNNEDGFTVELWWRNESGVWALAQSVSTAANHAAASFSDGIAGPDFRFRVKAFNAAGDSAWSNWH